MKRLLAFVSLFVVAVLFTVSCQKELSQETNSNNATFSLHDDSTLSCFPIVVSGTYYDGVMVRDTNYIRIIVNVKSTGNYVISSSQPNGFGFSDSGFFSKAGIDTLVLKAHGTPILAKSTEFSLTADSLGMCNFFVDVQDSTGTGLGTGNGTKDITDSSYIDPNVADVNTWHFTDTATGKIYNGIFSSLEGAGFTNDTLFIIGQAISTTDTLFGISLKIPSLNIAPGIYPVNETNQVILQTSADQNDFYVADDITASEGSGNSYITITSYANKQLIGSFHAYAEYEGVPTLIKGSFNCTVH